MTMARWHVHTESDCLFVVDSKSNSVVLQHNAHPGLRPYIHPLRGPDGKSCLTEDSPWHHPWQHGVSTGFHGVNGCDFWFDPGQRPGQVIGTIEPSTPRILDKESPRWTIEALWRHDDGAELLAEAQTWSLKSTDGLLHLDLDWTLRAIPDIKIEQGAYGGVFLRMPFRKSCNARVANSAGQQGDDTEQQPASWVDLTMEVNDGNAAGGISILDHPDNPGHPAHWRVDGQRGINPAPCIPGPIDLPAGQTILHRYRLVLYENLLVPEEIHREWNAYAIS
jgi:hypothetical protein